MGRQVDALRSTLDAMDSLGDVPAALVALVEGLAEAVDDGVLVDGKRTDASAPLWREYRTALEALMRAGAGDDVDDDTADFFVRVQAGVRSKVGDSSES